MEPHLGRQGKKSVGLIVNLLNKMQNPFALVLQGFVLGGLLFWAAQGDATPQPIAHGSSMVLSN